MNRSTNAEKGLLFLAVLCVLRAGRAIFLPLAAAMFLWILIWLLESAFGRLCRRAKLPSAFQELARIVSISAIMGILWLVIEVIGGNLAEASHSFARYQANVGSIVERFNARFGTSFDLAQLVGRIDMASVANEVVGRTAGLIRGVFMAVIYLVFILLEEKSMAKKLPLVFKGGLKKLLDRATVDKILGKIGTYLAVKTLCGVLTGAAAYALMRHIGLDFALFWALLMFLFNYIPTIGSIVASLPPIALSLLQFDGAAGPFLAAAVGITAIQVAIGQILEPRIMGARVGLSPLAMIVSLVVWGWIWGVGGMFLCVPIMLIALIVMYNVPGTKKFAVLLSQDGKNI
ncbi:MAG: AI-2E family transporter [Rickettsiales bacterium]|jgi:predicted PurR-regulated permease PerM|nr:AI-2E family transporter [Rickettsiales bacterium]